MTILWITSFNTELYEVSGQFLEESAQETEIEGDWFIGHEKFGDLWIGPGYDLDCSNFLKNWIRRNAKIIPVKLGGKAQKCKCSKPWARAEKDHKRGCHHTWFNRNASKWFRKIATLYHALEYNNNLNNKYTKFIWIDSDCIFKQKITERFVTDILFQDNTMDAFYLRGTERKVMEAGLVGYNFEQRGLQLLQEIIKYYAGNDFTRLVRWDDSYVIQKVMCHHKFKFSKHDIATTAGAYSEVFTNSLVGKHITHHKGKHGRQLGLMK